jgi:hypothetical protein
VSRTKRCFRLSANVDPNVVGGILVVAVIGLFGFYIWQDIRKKPSHSTSYSTRREPSRYPVHSEPQERDAYEEGYEQELGRQAAIEEARRQRIRDAQWKRDHPIIEFRNPTNDFLDDVEAARRKRKRNQW